MSNSQRHCQTAFKERIAGDVKSNPKEYNNHVKSRPGLRKAVELGRSATGIKPTISWNFSGQSTGKIRRHME